MAPISGHAHAMPAVLQAASVIPDMRTLCLVQFDDRSDEALGDERNLSSEMLDPNPNSDSICFTSLRLILPRSLLQQ